MAFDLLGSTCKLCGKKYHFCWNCGLFDQEAWPLEHGYCSNACLTADSGPSYVEGEEE